ncbi:MAG: NADH-quinone oxidoreductase subunit NuoG [Gammaproteobacteria bacterium]|nr:NADH-quinone oxidoreductase subunit NuoG [Gammaproteobacteria bacterium]
MPTIYVDGQPYEVKEGENLLQACLSAGLDLPYFCWHPAMGSVGACRQCAVIQYQDENDERGRLAMACMTAVAQGARFSIEASQAKEFRAEVIEWLMLNHPHDCPVCEEGGECHLQDMTVMTGHTFRRYRGQKRTFRNQYLGPFLNHEMNRCITCYRCVRYYRDYAGGTDLEAFGSRDRMYFGRADDGVLESEFAGNLVEVCPTGVFTDKPFSVTYTRKWDLQSAPSVCPGCALGCNIIPSERYGRLMRVHNRYHGEVNGYFLCDRGRFGTGFVNSDLRFPHAGVRTEDGSFEAVTEDAALERLSEVIRDGSVIGIGSPRASVEANFVLRALVGEESFSNGIGDADAKLVQGALEIMRSGAFRNPSMKEVEAADAVLVLGEDVSNTAPRLGLALRQSVGNRSLEMAGPAGIPLWQDAGVRGHAQHQLSPLFSATLLPTRIDDIATATTHGAPVDLARMGFAVAAGIDSSFAGPSELSETAFVRGAISALSAAERPLVVSGIGAGSEAVIQAAASVASALKDAGKDVALMLNVPEANTFGAGLIEGSLSVEAALGAIESGQAKSVIVLENDLFRRADPRRVEKALNAAANVVAIDVLENDTLERGTLVLPAASFAESEGTYVNSELRAQRFYQVFEPRGDIQPSWRWLVKAAEHSGRNDLGWDHIDDVIAACASAIPELSELRAVAPSREYRADAHMKIPRQTHRYSGRTAMHADVNVHEPKATVDEESPFSFSMEGLNAGQSSALIPYVWSPGWNSNQSVMRYQKEVGGALLGGDPGIRLFDGRAGGNAPRYGVVPRPFAAADAGFTLLALDHVFGSDELTMQSPPIAERAPAPYVVLNPGDAERLSVAAGDGVRCEAGDRALSFEVKLSDHMPRGAVGYLRGVPGSWSIAPGGPVTLEHDPDFVPRRSASENLIARG